MKAVMHHRHELELHSFRHIEPMKVDMHKLPQTARSVDVCCVSVALQLATCEESTPCLCLTLFMFDVCVSQCGVHKVWHLVSMLFGRLLITLVMYHKMNSFV